MKTPLRQNYDLPGGGGRYTVSDVPYQLDWTGLLEDGETIPSDGVTLEMIGEADTEAYAVTTTAGVTTFWLRGGTTAMPVQQAQVKITTSLGEAEGILLTWNMLG
jgi:hypothetical protein